MFRLVQVQWECYKNKKLIKDVRGVVGCKHEVGLVKSPNGLLSNFFRFEKFELQYFS
jgi:hypothetical protein